MFLNRVETKEKEKSSLILKTLLTNVLKKLDKLHDFEAAKFEIVTQFDEQLVALLSRQADPYG